MKESQVLSKLPEIKMNELSQILDIKIPTEIHWSQKQNKQSTIDCFAQKSLSVNKKNKNWTKDEDN